MKMNVLKIEVMTGHVGADIVNLYTDLPPCFPFTDQGAVLTFQVQRSRGEEYVKKAFPGVEVRTIK